MDAPLTPPKTPSSDGPETCGSTVRPKGNNVIRLVVDKSVFQRLCELPNPQERDSLSAEIYKRYEIVIPFALIEEVAVNWGKSGGTPLNSLMASELVRMEKYWMEDLSESSYLELIEGHRFSTPPQLNENTRRGVRSFFQSEAPEFKPFVAERKQLDQETIDQWKLAQAKIVSAGTVLNLKSNAELIQGPAVALIQAAFEIPAQKMGLLEGVFGDSFRKRHPERWDSITAAFEALTLEELLTFPIARNCVLARMIYWIGPIFVVTSNDNLRRKVVKNDKDNFADECYVAAALCCHRIITRDK